MIQNIVINGETVGTIELPDGTPDSVLQSIIDSYTPQPQTVQAASVGQTTAINETINWSMLTVRVGKSGTLYLSLPTFCLADYSFFTLNFNGTPLDPSAYSFINSERTKPTVFDGSPGKIDSYLFDKFVLDPDQATQLGIVGGSTIQVIYQQKVLAMRPFLTLNYFDFSANQKFLRQSNMFFGTIPKKLNVNKVGYVLSTVTDPGVDPDTKLLSQNLTYSVPTDPTNTLSKTYYIPNCLQLLSVDPDLDFTSEGFILEVWHRPRRHRKNSTPSGEAVSYETRYSPVAVFTSNTMLLSYLVTNFGLRQRKSQQFLVRIRRLADNAVSLWSQNTLHVKHGVKIFDAANPTLKIGNMYELKLK
jgi:hypothetical protein